MKQVLDDRIINIDGDTFDGKYLFSVPGQLSNGGQVDLSLILKDYKNESLDYKKDYKLWSEVYSGKKEFELFSQIFEEALEQNKKIHISNISLKEEIDLVKKLYEDLGYFDADLNMFVPDFKNCPITIGVNIRNIVYSFKDYKSKKEEVCFIPPPREPLHQKAIKNALNAGVISMIHLNDVDKEKAFLTSLLLEERLSLVRLSNCLYYNFIKRGFSVTAKELILEV